jgi:chemotaxis protein methyltransferase CheR
MTNAECVALLQWILPQLELRWTGYRRVRKQVCKRVARRMAELGLARADEYRQYLATHAEEWAVADYLCRVTISRFYRGKEVFAFLGSEVLPRLGTRARTAGRESVLAWSAGCGSGEEPYTLALVWHFKVLAGLPGTALRILATDIDEHLLERARRGIYPGGCLKDLPAAWQAEAFESMGSERRLREEYKGDITFRVHDIRTEPPDDPFDLVLCRNLAFTYFDRALQLTTAQRLFGSLREGGALVLGSHETLPAEATGFSAWSEKHRVYRRLGA